MLFDRDTGTALATPADSVPAPKLLGALLIHADWNRVIAHDVRTGALRWAQSIATDPTFAGPSLNSPRRCPSRPLAIRRLTP